jgi:hypothetical protein
MKRMSPIEICIVVEFTGDLIQIFILNLSIGPPYYKRGMLSIDPGCQSASV